MTLTGKERAEMRAEAHHLTATVHVGQHGLSPTLVAALDDALRARELVKVQLGRQVEEKPKDVARRLAEATTSQIVQVIGRTVTLFRENADLRQQGVEKPWRA